MRCRTCCNNKAFSCQTHINTTWVPICRRRHLHQPHHQTPSHNSPPLGLEEWNKLPAVMSSKAVFRCVWVRSGDGTVDEYAYQTCVSIGGRVFSGVLYDQGRQSFDYNNVGQSSKDPLNLNHHSHDDQNHHFIRSTTSMIQSHEAATVPPSSAEHFSSSSYPLSLATFRPAISYFTPPKTS